jgi:hypothetical protein
MLGGEVSVEMYVQLHCFGFDSVLSIFYMFTGSLLTPTITIVCRIDTLEKPQLQPRCVGFAVLKLCVDAEGMQPSPSNNSKQINLNAGQYLLPIVYGSVPSNGIFSESLMDKLPHIFDAYLSVRLFDPVTEKTGKGKDRLSRGLDQSLTTGRDLQKFDLSNTIIAALLRHQPGKDSPLPRLPIDELVASEIRKGVEVDAEEKKSVVRQVNEWLIRVFPAVHQKLPGVNTRFLLNYDHRIGAFVALDMLYNMPELKKPMRSTQEGITKLHSGSAFSKPFDDKLACFKTYFRYLPGSSVPKKLKGDATDFVIDDASMDLDFSSKEYNPSYTDEFSRTTGFELSHNACLLVVVTAVDILTSRKADQLNPTQYFRDVTAHSSALMSPKPRPITRGEVMSFAFEAEEEEKKAAAKHAQERMFKLRGLVGLYYGHDDPQATWWGIVPLIARNAPRSKKSKGSNISASFSTQNTAGTSASAQQKARYGKESVVPTDAPYGSSSSGEGGVKVNNWTGGAHAATSDVVERFEVPSTPVHNIHNGHLGPPGSINFSPASTPSQTPGAGTRGGGFEPGGSSEGSRTNSDEYFVNSGTHQVPLFHGLPPEDMTRSSNPLAWLLSNLTAQERLNYLKSGWLCGASTSHLQNFPLPAVDLNLSPGASAMVSIVDPRLRQFCHESVSQNPNVPIVQDTLLKVLRVTSSRFDRKTGAMLPPVDAKYRSAYAKFEYNQFRSYTRRSLESAVPPNIMHEALVNEINEKFTEKMSE